MRLFAASYFVRSRVLKSVASAFALGLVALSARADSPFLQQPARLEVQTGHVPDGLQEKDAIILSNEDENSTGGVRMEFDLENAGQPVTPLARLQLGVLEKIPVKRPGQKASVERGALHVVTIDAAGSAGDLAGSLPMKPGGVRNAYAVDVTDTVNEVLARPSGQRKLILEARITGKPAPFEVYHLTSEAGAAAPTLEIAPAAGWSDDFAQRIAPLNSAGPIFQESCLPIAEKPDSELTLRLLESAKRIIEVTANATHEKLEEGRDWILRDGHLVLPGGTHAPVQLTADFFAAPHPDKNGGTKLVPTAVRLVEGTWYHERQISVTYEPAAHSVSWPAPRSSLADLPRLQKLLTTKEPVTIVLFGDSISAGYNASKFLGVWPYQPCWGELVARAVAGHYGGKVTFMNHSRGGATSAFAATQADAQVAWFHPDLAILAYGMNDRSDARRPEYRANLEKIIDTVRARSPDTEFLIVAPMLNNPKQPVGLNPITFIHDEALKVTRPGVAFADVTAAHLELLKHKEYLDLSGNGANHPNDFLHRVYAQRVLEVLIPATR